MKNGTISRAVVLVLLTVGCSKPIESTVPSSAPKEVVLRVWVKSPERPGAHIIAARSLAEAIQDCPDLKLAEISGFAEDIVEVQADPAHLKEFQIDFSSVVSAVSAVVPEGVKQRMQVDSKNSTIELVSCAGHWNADWKIENVEALTKVLVQTQSGKSIPLRYIAALRARAGKAPATVMGQPVLYFKIAIGKSRSCLDKIIGQYRQNHPGVRLDVKKQKMGTG